MACHQSGSVLGSVLGIRSLDMFEYSKLVFCQTPLNLGLSDVSSQQVTHFGWKITEIMLSSSKGILCLGGVGS